jgi:aryl-alcohol dehydrogenase-like predicted oxidoreductase
MATQLNHYRLLGRSGLRVSPLCLGTMTFGEDWGWGAGKEDCRRQVDLYSDQGGNFIDTANMYTNGSSESILGDLLQGRRDQFVLATKYTFASMFGDPNSAGNHRKSFHQALEASLKRLQTDYIDLYWVHVYDGLTPADELMRCFDDAVRAGKILYAGVSDFEAWRVAQCNTLAELRGWSKFVGLQIEYSLVERTPERDLLPMARELGIGVTPWSPLAQGVLTGKFLDKKPSEATRLGDGGETEFSRKYLNARTEQAARAVVKVAQELGRPAAQVALAWLLHQPGVTSPIIGGRKIEQIADNLKAVEITLSAEQLKTLNDATRIEPGFPHDFLQYNQVKTGYRANTTITP